MISQVRKEKDKWKKKMEPKKNKKLEEARKDPEQMKFK